MTTTDPVATSRLTQQASFFNRGTRFARDRRGVTAIEFAMLALPFFALILAIFETSLIFLGELTLDNAVDRVARQVRTGEISKAKMSEQDFSKAICGRVEFLMDCSKLKIDLANYSDFAAIPAGAPIKNGDIDSSAFGYAPPASETIASLRVYYKWPVTTDIMRKYLSDMADGSHLLVGMAAFKTEPF